MNHHPKYSPSKLPALARCIHYESKQADDMYRARGKGIHDYMKRFLEGNIGSIPMGEVLWAAKGEWLAREVKGFMDVVVGIEQRMTLYDHELNVITWGYLDAWGWKAIDGRDYLSLVDAKSGQVRDYAHQLACYALMLMEETGEEVCRYRVLFCDSEAIEEGTIYKELAEEKVMEVIRRVEKGEEEPKECVYCDWCAKRSTCPVWTVPATAALTVVEDRSLEEQFRVGIERIKEDPILLGRFLTAWQKAEKLVEDANLKDTAKAYIAQGKSVDGWQLVARQGKEVIASSSDLGKLIRAAAKAPVTDFWQWAQIFKVSISALQKATIKLPKVEIARESGTTALIRKQP